MKTGVMMLKIQLLPNKQDENTTIRGEKKKTVKKETEHEKLEGVKPHEKYDKSREKNERMGEKKKRRRGIDLITEPFLQPLKVRFVLLRQDLISFRVF